MDENDARCHPGRGAIRPSGPLVGVSIIAPVQSQTSHRLTVKLLGQQVQRVYSQPVA